MPVIVINACLILLMMGKESIRGYDLLQTLTSDCGE
jgi:hypothetical protein